MAPTGEFAWPEGAKAAISLTFDGGLPEHWELVAPLLAEKEIRASFFVTVQSVLDNPAAWRKVVAEGHEIGSHSHLGITEKGDLPAWTFKMIEEDLRMTDKGLHEVLGCEVRSFALAGESLSCAEGDYASIIRRRYPAVRTPAHGKNEGSNVDLAQVRSCFWRDLVGPIESYLPAQGQWSVPVFERFFDLEYGAAEDDLQVLLGHLARRRDIWVAPFGEVASHIAATRGPLETKT